MPRVRTLPRIAVEGVSCIEIYRNDTLRKLDVGKVPTRAALGAIAEKFQEHVHLVRGFFEFQVGVPTFIFEDEGYLVWAVKDTKYTSAANKLLTERAVKYEKLIVERTNEYAAHLVEVYDVIEPEVG